MLEIKATNNPFEALNTFFQRLAHPGSGEVRKVSDAIAQGFQESFSREGNADGAWRALAPATVRMRQERGYGGAHPILRQTGGLRDTWTQRGAQGHVEEFSNTAQGWRLSVGASGEKAEKMEFGEGRVPARPVQPISDAAEQRIVSVIDYFVNQVELATLGR